MENASKALIIAGAILLSISIIAIGMSVFRQAQEAMEGTGLSSEQIATYNAKFENYEGTKSGSTVKTLCDAVRSHNLANTDDPSKQIQLTYGNEAINAVNEDPLEASYVTKFLSDNKIVSGKTYKVHLGYNKQSGLIVGIAIELINN